MDKMFWIMMTIFGFIPVSIGIFGIAMYEFYGLTVGFLSLIVPLSVWAITILIPYYGNNEQEGKDVEG